VQRENVSLRDEIYRNYMKVTFSLCLFIAVLSVRCPLSLGQTEDLVTKSNSACMDSIAISEAVHSVPDNWPAYENLSTGIRFRYPNDWQVRERPSKRGCSFCSVPAVEIFLVPTSHSKSSSSHASGAGNAAIVFRVYNEQFLMTAAAEGFVFSSEGWGLDDGRGVGCAKQITLKGRWNGLSGHAATYCYAENRKVPGLCELSRIVVSKNTSRRDQRTVTAEVPPYGADDEVFTRVMSSLEIL